MDQNAATCKYIKDGRFSGNWVCGRVWMSQTKKTMELLIKEVEYWYDRAQKAEKGTQLNAKKRRQSARVHLTD